MHGCTVKTVDGTDCDGVVCPLDQCRTGESQPHGIPLHKHACKENGLLALRFDTLAVSVNSPPLLNKALMMIFLTSWRD